MSIPIGTVVRIMHRSCVANKCSNPMLDCLHEKGKVIKPKNGAVAENKIAVDFKDKGWCYFDEEHVEIIEPCPIKDAIEQAIKELGGSDEKKV